MIYNPNDSNKETGFKGKSFIKIDKDKIIDPTDTMISGYQFWGEKKIEADGVDIRSYDPEFNFVKDDTIIEGEFQDERYWEHHEKELDEWLKVKPLGMPDDLCVIGFRGGEFATVPDLFLPKEYWQEGIDIMKKINPKMKFEVHTDDPKTAKKFFPKFKITHDMSVNWRSARYAKYAIIANSSFYIFPRWLKHQDLESLGAHLDGDPDITIAPKYWARHNTKIWALPSNYYKRFQYI